MSNLNTFEVDGCTFEVKRLSVDDTCAGIEILSGLGDAAGAELIVAALRQAKRIPEMLRLFAKHTKASRFKDGRFETGGDMIPLEKFVEDCFAGRHVRMVGFLVQAVKGEYQDFFSGAGELEKLLAPAATKD